MKKPDVLAFAERAEEHLLALACDLSLLCHREVACDRGDPVFHCSGLPHSAKAGLAMTEKRNAYAHGQYTRFVVCDPKRREIAKASVRDRVLHHAIHRVLAPLFDVSFIFDSYSSRAGKGTHTAGKRFRQFAWALSRNHTKTVWVLQLDVRRFFDSVDHEVLLGLLRKKILNLETFVCHCEPEWRCNPGCTGRNIWITTSRRNAETRNDGKENMESLLHLLEIIVRSFETAPGKGIPLGNLTSQLFSNVYLDPLDQFAKRILRAEYYLRYADDIAILSRDRAFLERCRDEISGFLGRELGLELHPKKVTLKRWHEGIDFLGYVHFPFHAILRTKTKRRISARLSPKNAASYFGVTRHVRAHGIERNMRDILKP